MPAATPTSSPAASSAAKRWIDPVRTLRNTMGSICDPNTAWMLLRSLETLEIRMQRAGRTPSRCAISSAATRRSRRSAFSACSKKARQNDIYDRHCTGPGTTFSLYLKGGEKEAFAFLDALQIANLAVSLGGTETLASAPAAMTHLSVPEERKKALDITPTTWCGSRSASRTRTI